MRTLLLGLVLVLAACSGRDDVTIRTGGQRCIHGDPKTMLVSVSDNGSSYVVSFSGDRAMGHVEPGCELTVDKKTRKVVKAMFYQ
ncbi:MAG: hypothetical protein J7494_00495 [Sphingobium sp.]|nr:hypothetical protein [Sphingobium sp.]